MFPWGVGSSTNNCKLNCFAPELVQALNSQFVLAVCIGIGSQCNGYSVSGFIATDASHKAVDQQA